MSVYGVSGSQGPDSGIEAMPHPDGDSCDPVRRRLIQGTAALGGAALVGGGGLFASACTRPDDAGHKSRYKFPKGFLWGAGTSALQHEGSPIADGAGPSAMYRWAHTPGKVPTGGSLDVSADFYNRFQSDIRLMRSLGLQAYNFETGWSRVVPDGTGRINERGLDFYDRLVDELLKAQIVPLCNLFVFDHPQAAQDRGGWLNRDCASWFAEYAMAVFARLGDRVAYWTTICELQILNHNSYVAGQFPPEQRDLQSSLRANHHLLLGQGLAVQAFRASGAKGQIGNQHLVVPIRPGSNSETDTAASQRTNAYFNLLATDAQMRGAYPVDLVNWYGKKWPHDAILSDDLKTIATPIDFFGMDYYFDLTVRDDPAAIPAVDSADLKAKVEFVMPTGQGLRDALVWVRDRYGKIPIYLLEIGIQIEDNVENGRVNDLARVRYFSDLLSGAHRAIGEGVDLRACFIWSFLDGWEFNNGLSYRYGLVYVDYETQERIIKASGHWYRDLIASNGFG